MELEVHPVQVDILLVLLFKPKAKYLELNTTGMTTDHFNFHVKRLVKVGLIKKEVSGKYTLTKKGKEFANRFDTDNIKLEKQAKVAIVVCCERGFGIKKQYLIQQRLKQPYYGFYGLITGKIGWGETVGQTAARELKEETGLEANLHLVGIEHKMDYTNDNKLLEDKFFFIFKGSKCTGKLVNKFKGGRNVWMSKRELSKKEEKFGDMEEIISMINKSKLKFFEMKYQEVRY